MVRRDADACALCDQYRKEDDDRDRDNEREHDAIWKKIDTIATCAARAADVTELKQNSSKHVPWTTFSVILLLAAGFASWLAIDHIGISRTVAANTEVIKFNAAAIRIFADNQAAMMDKMGLDAKPLPKQSTKEREGTQ